MRRTDRKVDVLLKFPAMPRPYSVRLVPRQVYYLDHEAEWGFAPDGTVIYDRAHRRKDRRTTTESPPPAMVA